MSGFAFKCNLFQPCGLHNCCYLCLKSSVPNIFQCKAFRSQPPNHFHSEVFLTTHTKLAPSLFKHSYSSDNDGYGDEDDKEDDDDDNDLILNSSPTKIIFIFVFSLSIYIFPTGMKEGPYSSYSLVYLQCLNQCQAEVLNKYLDKSHSNMSER